MAGAARACARGFLGENVIFLRREREKCQTLSRTKPEETISGENILFLFLFFEICAKL
jgi:hypothetical protein